MEQPEDSRAPADDSAFSMAARDMGNATEASSPNHNVKMVEFQFFYKKKDYKKGKDYVLRLFSLKIQGIVWRKYIKHDSRKSVGSWAHLEACVDAHLCTSDANLEEYVAKEMKKANLYPVSHQKHQKIVTAKILPNQHELITQRMPTNPSEQYLLCNISAIEYSFAEVDSSDSDGSLIMQNQASQGQDLGYNRQVVDNQHEAIPFADNVREGNSQSNGSHSNSDQNSINALSFKNNSRDPHLSSSDNRTVIGGISSGNESHNENSSIDFSQSVDQSKISEYESNYNKLASAQSQMRLQQVQHRPEKKFAQEVSDRFDEQNETISNALREEGNAHASDYYAQESHSLSLGGVSYSQNDMSREKAQTYAPQPPPPPPPARRTVAWEEYERVLEDNVKLRLVQQALNAQITQLKKCHKQKMKQVSEKINTQMAIISEIEKYISKIRRQIPAGKQ